MCWRGGCQGLRGPRAALHWGGRALNAPTALRCSVLRPHRQTRCVRCALYAQTMAMSMMTNALRAGRKPCAPRRPRRRAATGPHTPLPPGSGYADCRSPGEHKPGSPWGHPLAVSVNRENRNPAIFPAFFPVPSRTVCRSRVSPHTWFSNVGVAVAHQSPIRIKALALCGAWPLAASAAPENPLFPGSSNQGEPVGSHRSVASPPGR